MAEVLKLTKVGKIFSQAERNITALSDVNLSVKKGELVALTGPSGSGKTTLLQIAGLLDNPSLGQVFIRACIQTQRTPIFQKFCATFLQNFAAVSKIREKILQKNEPKFVENRGAMGLNTGSKHFLSNKIQNFLDKILHNFYQKKSRSHLFWKRFDKFVQGL